MTASLFDAATIFALATPAGVGGVAVVRISGRMAGETLGILTANKALPPASTARLRTLKHPKTGTILDKALVLWFPTSENRTGSYTGEDVAELHLHGGRAVVEGVLDCLGDMPNLRLAEAGEFTRRAFLNGRMDLLQAEAVGDLVHAETELQAAQALDQLGGGLSDLYTEWKRQLVRLLAYLEAHLDFPDEDLPPDMFEQISTPLKRLLRDLQAHTEAAHQGERIRSGIPIALIGAPNAGKSTLLNALAKRDAAIVSPLAGTTRDIIEVALNIAGYAVILVDTAGLRNTTDPIELEGIRRTILRANEASIRIWLQSIDDEMGIQEDVGGEYRGEGGKLDNTPTNSQSLHTFLDDIFTHIPPQPVDILLHTKADLAATLDAQSTCNTSKPHIQTALTSLFSMAVSAKTGEGLEDLLQEIGKRLKVLYLQSGSPAPTRQRHRAILQETIGFLDASIDVMAASPPTIELVAEELRSATRALGRLTGHVDVEDLLDVIFRDFCIGK